MYVERDIQYVSSKWYVLIHSSVKHTIDVDLFRCRVINGCQVIQTLSYNIEDIVDVEHQRLQVLSKIVLDIVIYVSVNKYSLFKLYLSLLMLMHYFIIY